MREARPLVLIVLLVGAALAGCTSGAAQVAATPGSALVTTTAGAPATASPSTAVAAGSTAHGSTSTGPGSSTTGFSERIVRLAPGAADEVSGIAASAGTSDRFFLIGDESGTDRIVAVDADGGVLAEIVVDGMSADNAEALASGGCGSTPLPGPGTDTCLYVGDIGDNAARREAITVYRLAEPALDPAPADPVPADQWDFRYPDGPHNAESMLIDSDGSLIIVTKPDQAGSLPHRLYTGEPGGGELTFVREFRPPAPERPLRTLFTGNVATDLASSPGRVLLLTYDEVQQYTAPDPAAPLTDFPDWPHRRLPLGSLSQAEGITATDGGCGYAVASEAGPGGSHGSLAIVSCG